MKTKKIIKSLKECYTYLPKAAKILDVGCLGFSQRQLGEQMRPGSFYYHGIDYCIPETIPPGLTFKQADLNVDPITFFRECLRVCKPSGLIYVEAPSERSLFSPGMPFKLECFFSLSFFDDLTRYLTSLKYRLCFPFSLLLALCSKNGKLLERCTWNAVGWASCLIASKPPHINGTPTFNYFVPER